MKIVRATFHLNDADRAALTGAEPKLSRIPPAHWRFVIRFRATQIINDRGTWLPTDDGAWIHDKRYACPQAAEEAGGLHVRAWNAWRGFEDCELVRVARFDGLAGGSHG